MDLFISYSHADRPFVERLTIDLVKASITVWYDQWELSLGDSLRQKISDGIAGAAFLAVVLSKASVESRWVQEELFAAMARGAEEGKVIVLPLLVDDCAVPPLLKDKVYADFRTDYDSALAQLIRRVRVAGPSQLGRVGREQFLHDYSFEWGTKEGRHHFRLYIVSHSSELPASFLCTIDASPNEALDRRLTEYEEAGFASLPRLMVAAVMAGAIAPSTKVWIEDERPGELTVEYRDRKRDYRCTFRMQVRRLGDPTDKAVLFTVGDAVDEILNAVASNARNEVTPSEWEEFGHFVISRPPGK